MGGGGGTIPTLILNSVVLRNKMEGTIYMNLFVTTELLHSYLQFLVSLNSDLSYISAINQTFRYE